MSGRFQSCQVTILFSFVIYKWFVGRYFTTMYLSCSSASFSTHLQLLFASIITMEVAKRWCSNFFFYSTLLFGIIQWEFSYSFIHSFIYVIPDRLIDFFFKWSIVYYFCYNLVSTFFYAQIVPGLSSGSWLLCRFKCFNCFLNTSLFYGHWNCSRLIF